MDDVVYLPNVSVEQLIGPGLGCRFAYSYLNALGMVCSNTLQPVYFDTLLVMFSLLEFPRTAQVQVWAIPFG